MNECIEKLDEQVKAVFEKTNGLNELPTGFIGSDEIMQVAEVIVRHWRYGRKNGTVCRRFDKTFRS